MLGEARLAAVVPISDRQQAVDFYAGTLGLREIEQVGFDVVFEAGGGTLLGAYVTDHAGKAGHTLAGFMVDDLDAAMAELRGRGVTFEDYDLPHLKTVDGVGEIEGERGAWFKDPDGNILAIGEPADGSRQ
jgi:catechol 2,3-dioxygenase-like lactoylglutathione lyase family enzyme